MAATRVRTGPSGRYVEVTGATGATGPAGPTGATGPAGPTGPSGESPLNGTYTMPSVALNTGTTGGATIAVPGAVVGTPVVGVRKANAAPFNVPLYSVESGPGADQVTLNFKNDSGAPTNILGIEVNLIFG